MHVTLVYVEVKPQFVEDFIQATEKNHRASVAESGNHRFDILRSAENPCSFVLYEAYKDQQSAADHKKTDHYLSWRKTVEDWMAQPRQGVAYHGLFPQCP